MTRAAAPALCVLAMLDFWASVGAVAVAVAVIFWSRQRSAEVRIDEHFGSGHEDWMKDIAAAQARCRSPN